jgi:transcriptional regulator with XRE-family HTH domain
VKINLKAERFNRGLTIKDVVEKTGVSKTTLIRLEQGAIPQARTAKAIADLYGMAVTDIWPVGSDEPRKPDLKAVA